MITWLTLLFLMINGANPEQIVQKQLDTYNSRDLEGFMAVMSEEVELMNFNNSDPIAKGFDEVKSIYGELFKKSPNLHSTLINRMVLGNTVIDHERIIGRMGIDKAIELIVVYEVDHEKIKKITVIR